MIRHLLEDSFKESVSKTFGERTAQAARTPPRDARYAQSTKAGFS